MNDIAQVSAWVPRIVFGLAVVGVLVGSVMFARATYRYIRATPFQRTRIRLAWRIGRHWKRDAVNLGLARVDENTRGAKDMHGKTKPAVTVVPKLRVVPEPYGVRAHLITIPKVGIEEVQKAAGWIADAWGCETVEAKRLKSGLVEIKGVFGNPLDEHHPFDFDASGWTLPIGRDPWGREISIHLKDLSGIKIAGMPGFGKTMLQLGWIGRMSRSPLVQFAFFDGKTSDPRYGDYGQVGQRAMFIVGDNPETANQRLTELVRLVKDRPAALTQERGTHKFWKHGPTEENPLIILVMDECHNYIDASGLKGRDKELIENNQRLMRTITKEARALGILPIVATQKQTTDAIPSAVRDNLGVGLCFAVFTMDAAEAALGKGIREDEANDPTELNDPDRFVGICVATGVPGLGARYARIRVGDVDEDYLLHLVGSSLELRRDVIPTAAPTVVDASAGTPTESTNGIPLQKPRAPRRKKAS